VPGHGAHYPLLPMPIYEYRCLNGHTFEVIQSMSDDPVETCEVCGAPVERVFHPVAVHFKGSGFYTTDYAKKAKTGAAKDGGSSGDSGAGSDSGSSSETKSSSSGGGDKAASSTSD
jgi:putative FmdB family regulatory protein